MKHRGSQTRWTQSDTHQEVSYLKWQKFKIKILKTAREKQKGQLQGTPIRPLAYFFAETLKAKMEWHYIFKVLKGKNLQPRIFYPARFSFRIERERKNSSEKQELKESNCSQESKLCPKTKFKNIYRNKNIQQQCKIQISWHLSKDY